MSAINLKTSFLLFLIEAAAGARWIRLIKAISDQRFLHVPLVPLSAAAAAAFFCFPPRALCIVALYIQLARRGLEGRPECFQAPAVCYRHKTFFLPHRFNLVEIRPLSSHPLDL